MRRRLGAWFRAQLRDQFGPMSPPVDDFGGRLRELGRLAATVAPKLEGEARRIVAELGTAKSDEAAEAG